MEEAGLERDWKLSTWEDGLLGADAGIVAVSFHSRTRVSGTVPSPDVGGRSQGVGVGDVLLPERERCPDSHWAGCLLWARLACSGRPPLLAPVVPKAQEQGGKPEMRQSQKKLELSTKHQCLLPWVRAEPGK